MNFKLIALDVDGTLINDDHVLTDLTKKAVRSAYEQGCRIVLCTGRAPQSTLPILEELGLGGAVITHNGAATIDGSTREVLAVDAFGLEQIMPLIAYSRTNQVHFDANTVFHLYVESLTESEMSMYEKFFVKPLLLKRIEEINEPIVKFTFFGEKSVIDRMERDPQLHVSGLRIMRSGDAFIDVMAANVSKGHALKVLSQKLGIPREQILAIGNYYNDLEMLEFAGVGVAMDNSPEQVKLGADYVTASNNEDGVFAALSRYGLV